MITAYTQPASPELLVTVVVCVCVWVCMTVLAGPVTDVVTVLAGPVTEVTDVIVVGDVTVLTTVAVDVTAVTGV